MADKDPPKRLSAARRRAQEQIERAEEEQRRHLQRRRIELANAGVKAYAARRMADAVKNFQTYIHILEDWKEVPEGGLKPSHFDAKRDVAEMLLISGVYWDLAKLYDRTQSPKRYREFQNYLEKFILFSKGMPFQPVCAETLRKYISNEKPIHKEDFRNAYKIIGDTRCFIASSLVDVVEPDTIPELRRFRDEVLLRNWSGRAFVFGYYRTAPAVARALDRMPEPVRAACGRAISRFSALCAGWSRSGRARSGTGCP